MHIIPQKCHVALLHRIGPIMAGKPGKPATDYNSRQPSEPPQSPVFSSGLIMHVSHFISTLVLVPDCEEYALFLRSVKLLSCSFIAEVLF